ncbi:DUF983 domain-containing protein [Limibaculum sp. M0105]|uniref:DUF983 domain-containing protein n=2 Tax=Thermohalobaculum xanthum TaxID=2753746 RepID=A0A8J7SGR5_9RHOB|nr:DUF983 domain-containing protein [Thermohalobaculum xanthum]
MNHDHDRFLHGSQPLERPLLPALLRGWKRRCPNCGGGPVFASYLAVRPSCVACGEPFHHHRADDLPAWATIVIVGHLVGTLLLSVEFSLAPPMWVHFALWPTLALGLTLWLLPRIKGMVVAMQWAWRMHGFEGEGQPD